MSNYQKAGILGAVVAGFSAWRNYDYLYKGFQAVTSMTQTFASYRMEAIEVAKLINMITKDETIKKGTDIFISIQEKGGMEGIVESTTQKVFKECAEASNINIQQAQSTIYCMQDALSNDHNDNTAKKILDIASCYSAHTGAPIIQLLNATHCVITGVATDVKTEVKDLFDNFEN